MFLLIINTRVSFLYHRFDIHVCITKDIVATYQSDFWGPWWNFGMVPLSKKDSWWTSFVVCFTCLVFDLIILMQVTLLVISTSVFFVAKILLE